MACDYDAHEALDRTSLIVSMIGEHLLDHQYVQNRPAISKQVAQAFEILSSVYQQIGAEHLGESGNG